MKFEVSNRCEKREGLVFKKTVYMATTRIELTEEEFEVLESMAKSKEWKLYPVGDYPITSSHSTSVNLDVFYSWVKKTKGVFEQALHAADPERRHLMIEERKEVAITVKDVIAARLDALGTSDDDISIEL